jgi:hypothetical protein
MHHSSVMRVPLVCKVNTTSMSFNSAFAPCTKVPKERFGSQKRFTSVQDKSEFRKLMSAAMRGNTTYHGIDNGQRHDRWPAAKRYIAAVEHVAVVAV